MGEIHDPLVSARFDALRDELLARGLLAEVEGDGRPLEMLDLAGGDPPAVGAFWADSATQAHRAEYDALVSGWDWTGQAQAAHDLAEQRRLAKESLAGPDPVPRSTRCALRVIYSSLVECRAKVNEVVAFANSKGASINPLTNRTWAQALQAVRQAIDAETDPEG